MDVLKDPDAVKQLASILKTNVRACKALGHPYVIQVSRLNYHVNINYFFCILLRFYMSVLFIFSAWAYIFGYVKCV